MPSYRIFVIYYSSCLDLQPLEMNYASSFCYIRKTIRTITNLWVVGRLLYDLRGHPERRSYKSVPLDLCVCQLARHAEVCEFYLALFRQQHISSWESTGTAGNFTIVQICQNFCQANAKKCVLYLWYLDGFSFQSVNTQDL